LFGRGASCINSGGEKIFPEEVDEVLKTHPAVVDAACVGVPDERFGEAICALVELRSPGAASAGDLVAHVRSRLAAFKAPRHVVEVDSLERGPAGKLDYELLRSRAEAAVRGGSPPNAALDR
ncbi:MAG: AMP-binding enzyme, partial [Acidimicrobiales bacterium]